MRSFVRAATLAALLALAAAAARRSDQDFEFDDDTVSFFPCLPCAVRAARGAPGETMYMEALSLQGVWNVFKML